MDDDAAIEVSGDHGASTHIAMAERLETPKILSHYQPPSQNFPPNTPGNYREEIEQTKKDIVSKENQIKSLLEVVEPIRVRFAATSDPTFAANILAQITLHSRQINSLTDQVTVDKQRLFRLEEQLARAEEEANQTARVSHTGLRQEGPDIAYISDIGKFQLMKTWLDEHRALLLPSPPCSGKTSFAVRFTEYLIDEGFSATYMNAALVDNRPNDKTSMDEVMKRAIGDTFLQFCQTRDKPFYLIVDEAQAWYPTNANGKVKQEFNDFWALVKAFLNGGEDWRAYLKAQSRGASAADSRLTVEVRLLYLAGYGEASFGTVATPLVFPDPQDPETNLHLPLGLNFLRLDCEKTHELIAKYTKFKASQGEITSFSFDRAACDLIFEETNGHVGAIRSLLFHVISARKTTKDDIITFLSSPKSRAELSVYRPFLSASESTILRLTPKDVDILVQCIASYKEGNHSFEAQTKADGLIKLGLFVRNGLTTMAFPSPLHFDLALYNVLHRQVELQQTHASFEAAIKEMVLRMDPNLLHATPVGQQPYERQWEDECCDSFRAMSDKKVITQFGRGYNQRVFLDIYVEPLQWGIELIRLGGGKTLEEHVGRFSTRDERYRTIPMQEYAVLNFTNKVPTQETLNLYGNNVWHLVYNDKCTKITVHRKDRDKEKWNMIGYLGRSGY